MLFQKNVIKKYLASFPEDNKQEKYFNQYAEASQALSLQISETDKEIDTRVFYLYGLTEEERKNNKRIKK